RLGGQFVGPIPIPQIDHVPLWNDLNPRVGVAYDLFGNGKTALKGSVGRYVRNHAVDIAAAVSPANAVVTSTRRLWNDNQYPAGDPRNGNYVPDCNLNDFTPNGECGAIDNPLFGTVNVITRYATDVTEGWGNRDYQWEYTAGVQHEVRPGLGISATWF